MHRIGEVARRVGVSASALRQWERQGLVQPARTRGRYRMYDDGDVAHLREVRRLREEERLNAAGIRRVLRGPIAGSHAAPTVDGRLLRRLRAERGLSLRAAAERSGLSVSFISSLERNVTGASVSALQRLTAAYGTTLLGLLGQPADDGRLVRAEERPVLHVGDGRIRIEQLAHGARQLEPQLFVLEPGASSDGSYAHEGEEFLYLLAGAMTVWVGESETYELRRSGDALCFPSTLPHRWRNDARGETRLLWINTPPSF
jgi:DNA-binding transcriptional MerR regulator/quercetin dioxygenase-like cupin family protein